MENDTENNEKNNELEVVAGDGNELEVSPVYDHLNAVRPKPKEKKKDIIIPEVKEKEKKSN